MENITYLFGAGASRNALPIVTEIPKKINDLINTLKKEENQLSKTEPFSNINNESCQYRHFSKETIYKG